MAYDFNFGEKMSNSFIEAAKFKDSFDRFQNEMRYKIQAQKWEQDANNPINVLRNAQAQALSLEGDMWRAQQKKEKEIEDANNLIDEFMYLHKVNTVESLTKAKKIQELNIDNPLFRKGLLKISPALITNPSVIDKKIKQRGHTLDAIQYHEANPSMKYNWLNILVAGMFPGLLSPNPVSLNTDYLKEGYTGQDISPQRILKWKKKVGETPTPLNQLTGSSPQKIPLGAPLSIDEIANYRPLPGTKNTPNMLSKSQIIDLLKKTGWKNEDIETMTAIIEAESGFNANNLNPNGRDSSLGLAQMNLQSPAAKDWLKYANINSIEEIYDPYKNLRAAHYLKYGTPLGWKNWGAYTNKSYLDFMPKGLNAVNSPSPSSPIELLRKFF